MKGKILVLSLVIAAFSISCSSPSLAYLIDTVSSVAAFTTGEVKINVQTQEGGKCTNMENTNECIYNTSVTNIGPSDAYVRIRVLVPESLLSGTEPLITFNTNTASSEYEQSPNQQSVFCNGTSGELCEEYIYTRSTPLAANATTADVISSITYHGTPSTSVEGISGVSSSGALDVSTSNIKIYTEAIQAQGFNNAYDAFAHFTN